MRNELVTSRQKSKHKPSQRKIDEGRRAIYRQISINSIRGAEGI
jgi:hypothetical protein